MTSKYQLGTNDSVTEAPTAALVLLRRRGHILCVGKWDDPTGDCWGLPGGKVEPGETPSRAAARELFEETGLRVRAEDLRLVYTGIYTSPSEYGGKSYRVATFVPDESVETGNPVIGEPRESEEGPVKWGDWKTITSGRYADYNKALRHAVEPMKLFELKDVGATYWIAARDVSAARQLWETEVFEQGTYDGPVPDVSEMTAEQGRSVFITDDGEVGDETMLDAMLDCEAGGVETIIACSEWP